MIAYIKGRFISADENGIVLENGGIGYNIQVPSHTAQDLSAQTSEVKVYTYLAVSEDAMKLFGFATRDELELFRLMLKVSGVGPKAALSILSTLTPESLRFAILADDVKAIAAAPGIGRKTAQKLILELKDKIDLGDLGGSGQTSASEAEIPAQKGDSNAKSEAIQALTALGYSPSESLKAVRGIELPEDADTESWIRAALKNLSSF